MARLWIAALFVLLTTAIAIVAESNTYDYIVVGSGPGGGPLAANLAKAGASVLLLEAGDDQGNNPVEEIAGWFFLTWGDPVLSWNFFVKYHTDDNITKQYNHLTWRTTDGQFYVGTDPPPGATMLGVFYPRAATLGGCSAHNALCAVLPSDSDWQFIANITGDSSWSASNMRQYFERLENNHYVPPGTPGHGFHGYLDICVNDDTSLKNQSQAQIVLEATAKEFGQDPNKIFSLIQADLNNDDPNRDEETGVFGFPAHRDPEGRRVSARNPVAAAVNATNPNGSKKYKLNLSLNSFVTKVLFNTSGKNAKVPQAIGVEYLAGKSMYSADPRYNASMNGTTMRAYARKEVILAGGVFNTPQMLKLSGIGPKDELSQFNIPVLVNLPGVGHNMQDNNEFGLTADASEDFVSKAPACTFGAPGDPCLAAWEDGTGPYTTGPLDSVMFKSSHSAYGERDIFMWATTGDYEGYWPSQTVNTLPATPASRFDFSMVKIHPEGRGGTVTLTSSNPRDMPEINFRFFEGTGEADLEAIAEGVEFGRKVFDSIGAPLGPFTESFPCNDTETCDVKEVIRVQSWSHHATSSCAIGADSDPMAVLDSRFRVRGTTGLRVVDGSAFPRTPGAFPVIPTFMMSEKASDVILQDTWH